MSKRCSSFLIKDILESGHRSHPADRLLIDNDDSSSACEQFRQAVISSASDSCPSLGGPYNLRAIEASHHHEHISRSSFQQRSFAATCSLATPSPAADHTSLTCSSQFWPFKTSVITSCPSSGSWTNSEGHVHQGIFGSIDKSSHNNGGHGFSIGHVSFSNNGSSNHEACKDNGLEGLYYAAVAASAAAVTSSAVSSSHGVAATHHLDPCGLLISETASINDPGVSLAANYHQHHRPAFVSQLENSTSHVGNPSHHVPPQITSYPSFHSSHSPSTSLRSSPASSSEPDVTGSSPANEDDHRLLNMNNNGSHSHNNLDNQRKMRRNRTVFTELQLMGLERRFDSQKYLSTPDRSDLARVLGLTQLQVKTWYQNRRMKWKKQVMQGGCTIPPTKPKGRPKKNSIPSLGLIETVGLFDGLFAMTRKSSEGPITLGPC